MDLLLFRKQVSIVLQYFSGYNTSFYILLLWSWYSPHRLIMLHMYSCLSYTWYWSLVYTCNMFFNILAFIAIFFFILNLIFKAYRQFLFCFVLFFKCRNITSLFEDSLWKQTTCNVPLKLDFLFKIWYTPSPSLDLIWKKNGLLLKK